jgi:hypothetical protein
MLFRYIMKDFEIVSVTPVTTVITFLLTFRTRSMSVVRFLHHKIFGVSFLITFISPKIVISVKRHVPFCHGLHFPFYSYGRFSQCSLVYSTTCSPYLHDLFQLLLILITKPTRCTNFSNLFLNETLNVSDSSSVHHQEFIHCTHSNGICHTGL